MSNLMIPVTVELTEDSLKRLRRAIFDVSAENQAGEAPPPPAAEVELPSEWKLLEEKRGVEYTWGEDHDVYDPFRIYEGQTSHGAHHLAIGQCERTRTHGRDRVYFIVLTIGKKGGLRAVAEFLATDDYDETGDLIAVIKGKDGTGRLFDSAAELPSVYVSWETATYRDRVDYPGSYLKQGLVCHEDDHMTMLNHCLAQMQLRGLG